jgi:hypothetical protein
VSDLEVIVADVFAVFDFDDEMVLFSVVLDADLL